MALDVAFNLEVRQTSSGDTNAGGFAAGAGIAAPSAPTVSPSGSGGTVAAGTYYVVVTYTDALGDTVISGQTSVTTSGATASATVTSPVASTGAKTWSCYFGTTSGGPYFPQGTGLTIGSNRVVTTTPPTTGTQPLGVDYSVQDSPQINVADGVANGTTTFTSATAGFTGAHVGNLIRVGTTNWRHIVGVTNATTVVLDASVSTNTSLPVVVGGGFLTPGITGAVGIISKSTIFLKYSATAYTMSASTNVASGSISIGGSINIVGYDVTRTIFNANANRPTVKPSANSVSCFALLGSACVISNLIIANPGSFTGVTAINGGQQQQYVNVKVNGVQAVRASSSGNDTFIFCDISTTSGNLYAPEARLLFCDLHDGGSTQINSNSTMYGCNIYNITDATHYAVQINNFGCVVSNCNFYHIALTPGGDQSAIQNYGGGIVSNCVFEDINPSSGNGYVFDMDTGGSGFVICQPFINNYYYNVKTALANPTNVSPGNIFGATLLTASPFVAPGSGNFVPNSTAGGGAVIRGASLPTTFPAGLTANALDAGAVQHAGAGGPDPSPFGESIIGSLRAK